MKKIICLIFLYTACSTVNAYTYKIFDNGSNVFYNNLNLAKKIDKNYSFELNKNSGYFDNTADVSLNFNTPYNSASIIKMSPNIRHIDGIAGDKAIFIPNGSASIEIDVKDSVLFSDNNIPSFTIEFYLKPTMNLANADIIKHAGMYTENGVYNYNLIRAAIINDRVVWEFKDFFRYGGKSMDITLSEGTYIKVNEWSHHSISFDAKTGRLVKYLNGVEEEVVYVTTTSDKNGGIYTRHISSKDLNPLILGSGFVGAIDGLNITSAYKRNYDLGLYNQTGEVISEVINLKSDMAYLQSINIDGYIVRDSDMKLYYRASDKYFSADNNTMPWIYIKQGEDLGYIKRKYVQVKIILSSDYKKQVSPVVNSVSINYDIPKLPYAPYDLLAKPLNGAVLLSWKEAHTGNAIGYKIYYSTIPGVYNEFAEVPIIIGKERSYLVEGLENDKVYYFKVSAFGMYGEEQESEASNEVYAIPKNIR